MRAGLIMDEKTTILQKVKRIFRRSHDLDGELPLLRPDHYVEPRMSFFRPWARRDAAINNLQSGFTQLTELMGAIRNNLERQGERHDELVSHLSYLPKVIDLIPETSRVQSETLRAIHQQLETQNGNQRQLASILERISQTSGDQRKILDALRERMTMLDEHDQIIADNLSGFGAAMQNVSRNSQTSAQILEQLRNNMVQRDGEMEKVLKTHNTRFMALLGITLFVSLAALASVVFVGYVVMSHPAASPASHLSPTTQATTQAN